MSRGSMTGACTKRCLMDTMYTKNDDVQLHEPQIMSRQFQPQVQMLPPPVEEDDPLMKWFWIILVICGVILVIVLGLAATGFFKEKTSSRGIPDLDSEEPVLSKSTKKSLRKYCGWGVPLLGLVVPAWIYYNSVWAPRQKQKEEPGALATLFTWIVPTALVGYCGWYLWGKHQENKNSDDPGEHQDGSESGSEEDGSCVERDRGFSDSGSGQALANRLDQKQKNGGEALTPEQLAALKAEHEADKAKVQNMQALQANNNEKYKLYIERAKIVVDKIIDAANKAKAEAEKRNDSNAIAIAKKLLADAFELKKELDEGRNPGDLLQKLMVNAKKNGLCDKNAGKKTGKNLTTEEAKQELDNLIAQIKSAVEQAKREKREGKSDLVEQAEALLEQALEQKRLVEEEHLDPVEALANMSSAASASPALLRITGPESSELRLAITGPESSELDNNLLKELKDAKDLEDKSQKRKEKHRKRKSKVKKDRSVSPGKGEKKNEKPLEWWHGVLCLLAMTGLLFILGFKRKNLFNF